MLKYMKYNTFVDLYLLCVRVSQPYNQECTSHWPVYDHILQYSVAQRLCSNKLKVHKAQVGWGSLGALYKDRPVEDIIVV